MTHSTDPAPGRWAACVQEILRSWYDMTGAAAPYLTAHGVADTLLESLVAEVEAATAADLREELRRAYRAIDSLREQHAERTARERQRSNRDWRQDASYRLRYEAALVREGINLDRAQIAETAVQAWVERAFTAERQLRNGGDQ